MRVLLESYIIYCFFSLFYLFNKLFHNFICNATILQIKFLNFFAAMSQQEVEQIVVNTNSAEVQRQFLNLKHENVLIFKDNKHPTKFLFITMKQFV